MYNILFGASLAELNFIQVSLATVNAPKGKSGLSWLSSNADMVTLREVAGVAYIDAIVDEVFMGSILSTMNLFPSAKIIGVWHSDGSPYGYHYHYDYDLSTGKTTKILQRDLGLDGQPVGAVYPLDHTLMLASKPDILTFDLSGKLTSTARPTVADLTSPWAGWEDRL